MRLERGTADVDEAGHGLKHEDLLSTQTDAGWGQGRLSTRDRAG